MRVAARRAGRRGADARWNAVQREQRHSSSLRGVAQSGQGCVRSCRGGASPAMSRSRAAPGCGSSRAMIAPLALLPPCAAGRSVRIRTPRAGPRGRAPHRLRRRTPAATDEAGTACRAVHRDAGGPFMVPHGHGRDHPPHRLVRARRGCGARTSRRGGLAIRRWRPAALSRPLHHIASILPARPVPSSLAPRLPGSPAPRLPGSPAPRLPGSPAPRLPHAHRTASDAPSRYAGRAHRAPDDRRRRMPRPSVGSPHGRDRPHPSHWDAV